MRRRAFLIVAVLVALPLATFARVLGHGFVDWDDRTQIYANPDFNPPTAAKVARYWRGPHMNLYLPVTYTLWGGLSAVARLDRPAAADGATLDARYFHAANLLLHVGSTLLVFAILRTLRVADVPAGLGAAVFAVHPVMVEPLAWASAMYTVLSGMFSLLAIWQYLRFATAADARAAEGDTAAAAAAPRTRRWAPFAIGTVALVLAILSKPSAVVVPVIAAALDVLLVRRSIRRAAPAALAWLLVALPFMILANSFQPAAWVETVPLWQRPIIAADAIAFYVVKILVPARLAADYGRFPTLVMTRSAWHFNVLIPIVLVVIAWIARRRAPWVAAALVAFVAGMGAYLGLAKFDFQYWSTVADRYLYLSMLGVALAIAFAVSAVSPHRRRAAYVVASLAVALLAVRSSIQTRVWRDTHALFAHTLSVNPNSVIAHNALGYLAGRAGDTDRAAAHYRAALKVRPHDGAANFNLGNAHLAAGQIDDAIARFRIVTQHAPPTAPAYNNLGAALARAKRYDEAETAFLAALRIDPNYEMAQHGLALIEQMRAAPATQR